MFCGELQRPGLPVCGTCEEPGPGVEALDTTAVISVSWRVFSGKITSQPGPGGKLRRTQHRDCPHVQQWWAASVEHRVSDTYGRNRKEE